MFCKKLKRWAFLFSYEQDKCIYVEGIIFVQSTEMEEKFSACI